MFARMMWSAFLARRARVGLALIAVSLGVTVSIALGSLALQVGDDLARTLRAAGPNFVVLPAGARLPLDLGGARFEPARAGLALPDSSVIALRRSFWRNNLLDAAPELNVAANVGPSRATVVGTWFERDLRDENGVWRTGIARLRPHWKIDGRWPRENEVALGHALAARLAFRPGQLVTVTAGGREEHWLVSGVLTTGDAAESKAWAPLESAQRLAARPGEVDRVWLSALVKAPPKKPAPDAAQDPKGYEKFMCTAYPANLARDLAPRIPGAEVLPMTELVAGEGMVVGRLNLLMLLLALAAIAASTLGLLSTTTAAVVERSVELGLLRALGATSAQIASLLLAETTLVAVAGGTLGWAIGIGLAAVIRGQTFGAGASVPPLLLPLALMLSLAIALLGTIGPLRAALRLDPATVLRG